jgi:hypothetical protein
MVKRLASGEFVAEAGKCLARARFFGSLWPALPVRLAPLQSVPGSQLKAEL